MFKCCCTNVQELCNLIYSFSLFPLTSHHTRETDTSASLIENIIWATENEASYRNSIIKSDISDNFSVLSEFTHETFHQSPICVNKSYLNDFALNTSIGDLEKMTWNYVLRFDCPNESFTIFYHNFNSLFQKHQNKP